MGPKAFITCYVCFREFGSRSIPFHEPKCLERWRRSNRNLPPEKRSSTPVKPIGWKNSEDTTWLCTNCQVSVAAARRGEHAASCFDLKAKSGSFLIGRKIALSNMAAGATKSTPSSPKKGKENKNSINKSEASPTDSHKNHDCKKHDELKDATDKTETIVSTSNKSVRPQTKILRRPTPNLKHPVIQVESDDSGDSSDKSKEANPKRMKHNNNDCTSDHKPKNFIMYNKYNVERNTKNSPKERSAVSKEVLPSSGSSNSIPYPCNSCSRSVAPERLHSHTRKDARGMMLKKASSTEAKTPSPQKKAMPSETEDKKPKELKNNAQDSATTSQKVKESDHAEKTLTVPKVIGNVGSKRTVAPTQTVCHVCGKDPGPCSLSLHENKCLEKWKRQNGLLSPTRRKPLPQKTLPEPEPFKLEACEQLDEMDPAWLAVQSQLVPCPTCSRTFFPERLPVHQRVCKGKSSSGKSLSRANSLRESSTYNGDEELGDKQTIYVPCYICGRNFGSWVIQMHESRCLRKWRRENERLPENLQQQEPHKPQLVLDVDSRQTVEPTEDVAWESHLQQLVPCQRCGRTFFPDRLQVHGRSCKGQVAKQLLTPRTKATSSTSKGT